MQKSMVIKFSGFPENSFEKLLEVSRLWIRLVILFAKVIAVFCVMVIYVFALTLKQITLIAPRLTRAGEVGVNCGKMFGWVLGGCLDL